MKSLGDLDEDKLYERMAFIAGIHNPEDNVGLLDEGGNQQRDVPTEQGRRDLRPRVACYEEDGHVPPPRDFGALLIPCVASRSGRRQGFHNEEELAWYDRVHMHVSDARAPSREQAVHSTG